MYGRCKPKFLFYRGAMQLRLRGKCWEASWINGRATALGSSADINDSNLEFKSYSSPRPFKILVDCASDISEHKKGFLLILSLINNLCLYVAKRTKDYGRRKILFAIFTCLENWYYFLVYWNIYNPNILESINSFCILFIDCKLQVVTLLKI